MRPLVFKVSKVIATLAIAALMLATPLGIGCGHSGDEGSERAVEWGIDPPVGPNWARIRAVVEVCHVDPPLLERPIVEYQGNRVYIELRQTPEELSDDVNGCLLELLVAFKKNTFDRDLDELVLFDASTDPPEQRWPTESPLPTE